MYSGVVSLRSIKLILLIGELIGLQAYQADTKEKVYFEAGSEFRVFGLEGYTMVINKALYGLKTSGKRYHERFADTMCNDGFTPCRADKDVWMRRNGNVYEYIDVYVDDLLLIMKNPKEYLDRLVHVHKYKLKWYTIL